MSKQVFNYDGATVEVKEKKSIIPKLILCVLLACVIAAGVCCAGFASRNDEGKWFENWNLSTWHWSDIPDAGNVGGNVKPGENTADKVGGSDITGIESKGVTVHKAVLPRTAYAAMGVSERAERAYTLTAEVLPEYASDKSLDWTSLAFQNTESAWATGKTVTDYVTVTPGADGFSAVLTCLQDFGEPILLTVKSISNPDVSATCFVNYYQRIKSCDFAFYLDGVEVTPTFENGVYKLNYTGAEKDYTVEARPVYSAYTLTDTYTTTIDGALTSTFGYTATEQLNSLKLPAGLSGGDIQNEDIDNLSNQLLSFSNFVDNPPSDGEQEFTRRIDYATKFKTLTDKIEADGYSTHPRYAYYKEHILSTFKYTNTDFYGRAVVVVVSSLNGSEIRSYLDSYEAPDYTYYGAAIPTYNDFVTAVNRCNNAGVGVIDYSITINGEHSNYTTNISLGYKFQVNVQDIVLSDPNVNF